MFICLQFLSSLQEFARFCNKSLTRDDFANLPKSSRPLCQCSDCGAHPGKPCGSAIEWRYSKCKPCRQQNPTFKRGEKRERIDDGESGLGEAGSAKPAKGAAPEMRSFFLFFFT